MRRSGNLKIRWNEKFSRFSGKPLFWDSKNHTSGTLLVKWSDSLVLARYCVQERPNRKLHRNKTDQSRLVGGNKLAGMESWEPVRTLTGEPKNKNNPWRKNFFLAPKFEPSNLWTPSRFAIREPASAWRILITRCTNWTKLSFRIGPILHCQLH